MLPEVYHRQVENYKERLVNFKTRRRKETSICPSPELVLRMEGKPMFEDKSTNSSKASPLTTNTQVAATTSRRKKRSADSASTSQQPPKKKRPYRKRANVQNTGSTIVSQCQGDDMMSLTERFAQQHYTNMLSLPVLTQQQMAYRYVPTSMSLMGFPIWMGRSDLAASQTQTLSAYCPGMPNLLTMTSLSANACLAAAQGTQMGPMVHSAQPRHTVHPVQPQTVSDESIPALSSPSLVTVSSDDQVNSSLSSSLSCSVVSSTSEAPSPAHTNPSSIGRLAVSSASEPPSPSPAHTNPSINHLAVSSAPEPLSPARANTTSIPSVSSSVHVLSSASEPPSPVDIDTSLIPSFSSSSELSPPIDKNSDSHSTQPSATDSIPASSSTGISSPTSGISTSPRSGLPPNSRGKVLSVSSNSQSPSDLFPKGPHYITVPITPSPTSRVDTVTSIQSGLSSFVQPHTSLLAPECRQCYSTSLGSAQQRPESERNPDHGMELTHDPTRSLSVSSPLNVEHPVGAAVSALLSLSDRTNSRSPRSYATSPMTRSCTTPLLDNSPTHSQSTSPGAVSEGSSLVSTASRSTTMAGRLCSAVTHQYTPDRRTAGSRDTPLSGAPTPYPALWRETPYVQVTRVPDAVQCSECLAGDSNTMILSGEPQVSLLKVDGPSLISTHDSCDDDVPGLSRFTRESSVGSDASLYQSGSITPESLPSTPSQSPRENSEFILSPSREKSSDDHNNS